MSDAAGRDRGQHGMTMVETLLTVAISALITVPMLGWAVFGLQQHAEVRERNVDGTSVGLLRAYFSVDVAEADAATTGGEARCAGRGRADRLLELLDADARIEYVLVDDGSVSLERRRCRAEGGGPTDVVRLVDDVLPAGTRATCSPGNDAECRFVTLQVMATDLRTVTLEAGLRVDALGDDELRPPVAVIEAEPREGLAPLTVRLDATRSVDPAGSPLTYEWDLGDGTRSDRAALEHRYTSPGERTITLTVTSERKLSATATVAIRVTEGAPTAVVERPDPGAIALVGSPVTLSARGSLLADGRVARGDELSYSWDLGDGRVVSGLEATVSFPARSPAGGHRIRLTVTDRDGRSGTTETSVIVLEAPRPTAPTGLRQTNSGQEQGRRFIELAWDRVEGADRYEVYLRCTNCPETAAGEESGTTVRIRGLDPGRRSYLASVRARSAASGEWSDWSDEIEVRS